MKTKFKLLGMLLTALLLLAGIRAEAAPQGNTDWNRQIITVTGTGVAPEGMRPAQARVLARRAAIADAYRMLAEYVQGVNVDAETTVEQLVTTSDTINLSVQAVVKGAAVVNEQYISDGSYEVTVEMPLFGNGGLASAVILPTNQAPKPFPEPQVTQPTKPTTPPAKPTTPPAKPTTPPTKPTTPPEQPTTTQPSTQITTTTTVTVTTGTVGNYTGLIVDCRGMNVNPVMSPVIKNTAGEKIYGHENLDYSRVISDGMASYAEDMSQADRAGSNPLIVKAELMDNFNANPVVSVETSNRILTENKSTGFLSKTAVVFLY